MPKLKSIINHLFRFKDNFSTAGKTGNVITDITIVTRNIDSMGFTNNMSFLAILRARLKSSEQGRDKGEQGPLK